MKTIIDTVEEAIEKEQWNLDYHSKLTDKAYNKLNRLKQELQILKGICSNNAIGVEPELVPCEAILEQCEAEVQQLQLAG